MLKSDSQNGCQLLKDILIGVLIAGLIISIANMVMGMKQGFASVPYDKPPYTGNQSDRDDYKQEALLRGIVTPSGYSYKHGSYVKANSYVAYEPSGSSYEYPSGLYDLPKKNSMYDIALNPRLPVGPSLLGQTKNLWKPQQSQIKGDGNSIRIEETVSTNHVPYSLGNDKPNLNNPMGLSLVESGSSAPLTI